MQIKLESPRLRLYIMVHVASARRAHYLLLIVHGHMYVYARHKHAQSSDFSLLTSCPSFLALIFSRADVLIGRSCQAPFLQTVEQRIERFLSDLKSTHHGKVHRRKTRISDGVTCLQGSKACASVARGIQLSSKSVLAPLAPVFDIRINGVS